MIVHESNGDMRINGHLVPLRRTDRLRQPAQASMLPEEPKIELSAYVVAYLILALLVLAATAACCGVVFLATV